MGMREIYYASAHNPVTQTVTISTGAELGTLTDVVRSDAAGHFTYHDNGDPRVRNRFIVWRSIRETLELEEYSLDVDLSSNVIGYRLQNCPILPGGVYVSESDNRKLVIVLVSTMVAVHRFVFHHPFSLGPASTANHHGLASIFQNCSVSNLDRHFALTSVSGLVPHTCCSTITHSGSAVFALSHSDGSIVVVTLPPVGVDLLPTSITLNTPSSLSMKRLFGIVNPFGRSESASSECVTSIEVADFTHDTLLLCNCLDFKIRIWSYKKQSILKTIILSNYIADIASTSTSIRLSGASNNFKVFQLESNKFVLMLYVKGNNLSSGFISFVCGSVDDDFSFVFARFLKCGQNSLVDFSLTSEAFTCLFTDDNNIPSVEYSVVDRQNKFQFTNLQSVQLIESSDLSELQLLISNRLSTTDHFIKAIFKPGRFLFSTVEKALQIVCSNQTIRIGTGNWKAMYNMAQERLSELAELETRKMMSSTEANVAADDDTFDTESHNFINAEHQLWLSLLRCCIDYHTESLRVLSLVTCSPNTGLYGVVRDGMISVFHQLQQQQLTNYHTDPLDDIIVSLDQHGTTWRFDDVFKEMEKRSSSSSLLNQVVQSLVGSSSSLIDVAYQFVKSVDLFNFVDNNCSHQHNIQLIVKSFNNTFASRFGVGLVSVAVLDTIRNRLSTAKKLVVVLAAAICKDNNMKRLELNGLIVALEQTINHYQLLDWICSVTIIEPSINSINANNEMINNLNVSANGIPLFSRLKPSIEFQSVLNLLLESNSPTTLRFDFAHFILHQLDDDEDDVSNEFDFSWTSTISSLNQFILAYLWPTTVNVALLLLRSAQFDHLLDYCQRATLLLSNNLILQNTYLFFEACALLHLERFEQSFDRFKQAAFNLGNNSLLISLIFSDSVNPSTVEYFIKIIRLFEPYHQLNIMIELAQVGLTHCNNGNDDNNDDVTNCSLLWSLLFKFYLQSKMYNQAFDSIFRNPDETNRKTNLRQFIVTLTDENKLQLMMSYNFKELEPEVVNIISSRARAVDMMTRDFYDILFAYHIRRKRYRNAAQSMYECALRLSQEVIGIKSLKKQLNCLLSARSTLSLFDPDDSWLPHYINHSNDSSSLPPVQLITLECLNGQLLLVRGRLYLAEKHHPMASIVMNADDTITGLLGYCQFDLAIAIAISFKKPFQNILRAVTYQIIFSSENTSESNNFKLLQQNRLLSESYNNDSSWNLLIKYLELFKQHVPISPLECCVAEVILSYGYEIPLWLKLKIQKNNCAQLIRLYVQYDKLTDAVEVAVEHIDLILGKDMNNSNVEVLLPSSQQFLVPFCAFDYLKFALTSNVGEVNLKLIDHLENKVCQYIKYVECVNNISVSVL